MEDQFLLKLIQDQVKHSLETDSIDKVLLKDTICLLLLKRRWQQEESNCRLSEGLELKIVNQMETLMNEDKHSFENVLYQLNQLYQ